MMTKVNKLGNPLTGPRTAPPSVQNTTTPRTRTGTPSASSAAGIESTSAIGRTTGSSAGHGMPWHTATRASSTADDHGDPIPAS